jgi:nicotinic acid phosphoribosyltransferase
MAALLVVKNTVAHSAIISINSDTVNKLNAYAAFTDALPDAVIGAALEYIFTTDKEFQTYLHSNTDVPQLLAIRKPRGSVVTRRKKKQA